MKHLIAAALLLGSAAQAQEFYDGKTVTLAVAAAPGGMADSVARGFAHVFAGHIPGTPEIVVQNMPGAGGLLGGSWIMNKAAKDGTEIAFLLGNVITTPLVTGKTQFDPREVTFLGALDSDDYPYALYAFDTSRVQSADDLTTAPMIVGSTSFTNYNRVFPAMLNEYAGLKLDIVSGYKGSGEVYLAMERGEVEGWVEGTQTLRNPIGPSGEYIAEGRMKPLLLLANAPDQRHPDLPVALDLIDDPEQKAVATFLFDSSAVGRPLVVPEEVPQERVALLRQAVQDALNDPELARYLKESAGIASTELQSAEEIEAMIDGFYATPDNVLDKVRGFMGGN